MTALFHIFYCSKYPFFSFPFSVRFICSIHSENAKTPDIARMFFIENVSVSDLSSFMEPVRSRFSCGNDGDG